VVLAQLLLLGAVNLHSGRNTATTCTKFWHTCVTVCQTVQLMFTCCDVSHCMPELKISVMEHTSHNPNSVTLQTLSSHTFANPMRPSVPLCCDSCTTLPS
jgi:hypothetical protein